MEYVIKVEKWYFEDNGPYDISSNSSEVVALVDNPDSVGLAKLTENIDEFNLLMNLLSRSDLSDIIKMFGKSISLDEMYLVASFETLSVADIEEYVFSKAYPEWVQTRKSGATSDCIKEHHQVIRQHVERAGNGYKAMVAMATEMGVEPMSREEYDSLREKVEKKVYIPVIGRRMKASEVKMLKNIATLEEFLLSRGGYSYASKKALETERFWAIEAEANPLDNKEDEEEYGYREEGRNITIAPFKMPKNGVLLLSKNGTQSYCHD